VNVSIAAKRAIGTIWLNNRSDRHQSDE